jgi:hypothetical protein
MIRVPERKKTEKSFLYHRVPENLMGTLLYPLYALKTLYPQVFQQEVEKYACRMHLMDVQIPILNCRWNDVIHLAPIHPSKIKRALLETGNTASANRPLRYFIIPPEILEQNNLVYFKHSLDTGGTYNFLTSDVMPFDITIYREIEKVSMEQIKYFEQMALRNERPLLLKRMPHVFYKGMIPVENLPTVEW